MKQPLEAPKKSEQDKTLKTSPPKRSFLLLTFLTVAMVFVPFLFWYQSWFGRTLTEKEIDSYLSNDKKPRKSQHAIAQITEMIEKGYKPLNAWYPKISRLADHNSNELRATVAWFMGIHPEKKEFYPSLLKFQSLNSLLKLLNDKEPMVRRNAALSLVAYKESRARQELRRMLSPFILRSPGNGTIRFRLKSNDAIDKGTLIARINTGKNKELEVRSPVPGTLKSKLIDEGSQVVVGDQLALLSASHGHVREALRALYLLGKLDDIPLIKKYTINSSAIPLEISDQARQTQKAILERAP